MSYYCRILLQILASSAGMTHRFSKRYVLYSMYIFKATYAGLKGVEDDRPERTGRAPVGGQAPESP